MLSDFRFALRQIAKSPGFSLVAVLTLALAIGANVAIFSAVDAVLLHPLPYPEPDRLVFIGENLKHFNLSKIPSSALEYLDYRNMASSLAQIGGVSGDGSYTLTGDGNPENIPGLRVTASMFQMLDVKPVAGSLFTADEEQYGRHRVAVISESLWKKRYGSDASLIWKNIQLNQESYRVVGVIRPILEYRFLADIWTPLAFKPEDLNPKSRGSKSIDVIGRLKPGVALAQAQAEFRTIAANLQQKYPDSYEKVGFSLDVDPLSIKASGDLKKPLLLLIAAVGGVMLIACANVSNLLLARAMIRRREMSVRAALGATRSRIVRQLLTESLLLAFVAGAVGVVLALGGLELYARFGPNDLIHGTQPEVNLWVLAFSILLSIGSSVVFGLVPALETARVDLNDALKEGARGSTGGRRLLRESMVAIEVAASLVLLIGAGLLVRSFVKVESADPGFRAENVLTALLVLPPAQYKQPAQLGTFRTSLLDRVRALPGVVKADSINFMPFSGNWSASDFTIEGHPFNPNDPSPLVVPSRIGPDYFGALGIPLRRGRTFGPGDDQGAPPVAIIDETVVKKFYTNLDPVGTTISGPTPDVKYTVVGVVGAVKYRDLGVPPDPIIYYSAAQNPPEMLNLVVKTAGDPLALIAPVRHQVAAIDSNLPVSRTESMQRRLEISLARQRFSIQLMAVFAAIAAILAAIGIYGVLAYLVDQRRRELGIRMALGARPGDVLGLVLRQGSLPVIAGLIVGVASALGLTWFLKSVLYEISVTDPLTFVCVSAGLIAVALIAMFVPAMRATRVDPLDALREQ